jgi:hypothetical protein
VTEYGIYNKRLKVVAPDPYRFHSATEAAMAREELISMGKDVETRIDLADILEVVQVDQTGPVEKEE